MGDLLLLLNAAATGFMVGLIWFVQIVHYPLHGRVSQGSFQAYHLAHVNRTTWVVGPPMVIELTTAVALLFRRPDAVPLSLALLGVTLVGLIWIATMLLQVPQHRRLRRGWDSEAHSSLVRLNWVRTALWSTRGALTLGMLSLILTSS